MAPPRVYYSSYAHTALQALAATVRASHPDSTPPPPDRWVIFDNTAAGCATSNALELQRLLKNER